MNYSLDSNQSLKNHYQIIRKNTFLKQVYRKFYKIFAGRVYSTKTVVELGSGSGFIKEVIPQTITSDVIKGSGIEKVFSASKIPFPTNSVGAYVMLNVFHHIKNPETALKEMARTLKKDGEIIMIEPYISWWGYFIYRNFHHEMFDPKADWKVKGQGRMSDSNGALPWIIFVRDRQLFQQKFPNLKIINIQYHTPIAYLFSGGLSKRQLLPESLFPIIDFMEKVLSPLAKYTGMFMTIVLKKDT